MNRAESREDAQGDSDVCLCGHSIHKHEAVHDCKCYVYGCDCAGFEAGGTMTEQELKTKIAQALFKFKYPHLVLATTEWDICWDEAAQVLSLLEPIVAGCQADENILRLRAKEMFKKLRQALQGEPTVFPYALDAEEIEWLYRNMRLPQPEQPEAPADKPADKVETVATMRDGLAAMKAKKETSFAEWEESNKELLSDIEEISLELKEER